MKDKSFFDPGVWFTDRALTPEEIEAIIQATADWKPTFIPWEHEGAKITRLAAWRIEPDIEDEA
jgi:hypothetical protein